MFSDLFSLQFGLGVDPDDENVRVPIMVWNTCAFSIQSIGKWYILVCNILSFRLIYFYLDCDRSSDNLESSQLMAPALVSNQWSGSMEECEDSERILAVASEGIRTRNLRIQSLTPCTCWLSVCNQGSDFHVGVICFELLCRIYSVS